MCRVLRLFALTSSLVLAIASIPAYAQTGLATLTGLATDNSGAAVPGVTVTATNQATNVDYTAVSNEAGAYVITGVPIGAYVVRSELTGFKSILSNVSLSAGQTARVDFKLEVGTVEERIEVAATGAVLQTENAVVGQTLQREQVEKLPIQGRNLATAIVECCRKMGIAGATASLAVSGLSGHIAAVRTTFVCGRLNDTRQQGNLPSFREPGSLGCQCKTILRSS
jgi:hypothetical protein